jgi:hypothetical protein
LFLLERWLLSENSPNRSELIFSDEETTSTKRANPRRYRRPRRAVAFFALRATPRALRAVLRTTLLALAFAVRAEARAFRAGFDRRAFATVLLLFRASFVARRFTPLTAVSVPPTIASFAASALAAIAPSVDPIDSATLTRRSCDFPFCELAKAGSFKWIQISHAAGLIGRTEIASRCGNQLALLPT